MSSKPTNLESCNDGKCPSTRRGERHTHCSQIGKEDDGDFQKGKDIATRLSRKDSTLKASEMKHESLPPEEKSVTPESGHSLGTIDQFPKSIGVIFLIGENEYHYEKERKKEFIPFKNHRLFDPVPCAHLLLQLNANQDIFNFHIISPTRLKGETCKITSADDGKLFEPFDRLIKDIEEKREWNIDYWIGLSTLDINEKVREKKRPQRSFYEVFPKDMTAQGSGKIIGLITSSLWEEYFSPPSLFEYMTITAFMCALTFLSNEFGGELQGHKPNGCIFDFTLERKYYRIAISNPFLCCTCKDRILKLDAEIRKKSGVSIDLLSKINKILSLKWMGSPQDRNTPLFNLKKNYRYDVDRNSGFNKRWWEKFRESILEKGAEWTIGKVIETALAALVLVLLVTVGIKIVK